MIDYARRIADLRGVAGVLATWRQSIAERTEIVRHEIERKAVNGLTHIEESLGGMLSSVSLDNTKRVPVFVPVKAKMNSMPQQRGDGYGW